MSFMKYLKESEELAIEVSEKEKNDKIIEFIKTVDRDDCDALYNFLSDELDLDNDGCCCYLLGLVKDLLNDCPQDEESDDTDDIEDELDSEEDEWN